ncbi:MAG: PP2C family protein-serine/threonine phosphatase [Arachnia sp.]
MAFSLRFEARSDVGRVRRSNQDSGYASPTLLLVADGMGGAAGGDVASAVAVHATEAGDRMVPADQARGVLEGIVGDANDELTKLIEQDPTLDGMGTTVCGASFDGTSFTTVHIGDSRCYLLRGKTLSQLTHDHSWVQALIDEGRLTPAQAATHPHRSLILKVLNGQAMFEPDYDRFDARLGDRILFCSDGLSGLVNDVAVQELLGTPDLGHAADALIAAANAAGGHDNITAVVAEVVEATQALTGASAQIVGSAAENPTLGHLVAAAPAETDDPDQADQDEATDEDPEITRYAPQAPHRRWPTILGITLAALLLLGGGAWGTASYASSRYFIAEADGHVAIYNGLPGSLFGWPLHTLTERETTNVADLPVYYQRVVHNTIGSSSLEDARITTEQLAALAERCIQVRQERQAPSSTPTASANPSGLSTSEANYPTYLAPITPTVTEEADPEAC